MIPDRITLIGVLSDLGQLGPVWIDDEYVGCLLFAKIDAERDLSPVRRPFWVRGTVLPFGVCDLREV